MRGLYTERVVYSVAASGKSKELKGYVRKNDKIYLGLKNLMDEEGIRAANKYDVLKEYSLLPYLRPIQHESIMIYPMPALDPLDHTKLSNHPILPINDIADFARQMVCVNLVSSKARVFWKR